MVKVETFSEKQSRLFREFVQGKQVMIVDSRSFSRTVLARALVDIGVQMSQITLESSYQSASESIAKRCPELLISEYDLEGGFCGLDLLVEQRRNNQNSQRSLFILITGNTSQAAVARAAEEDVDGYLLKPYTNDGLRMAIMKYAVEKAYPSPYTQTIERGKEKLLNSDLESALQVFEEAMPLDPKPALAFFYHGMVYQHKQTYSDAEHDFNEGLHRNRLHYKCLVALFDLYMGQKRNKEAYEVVRRMSRYFPANPDRLATVLRLAVMNEAYEDIERYYQLFLKLDARDELLIRYVCAALIICGKYYLQKHENKRAVELFNRAKATGARNPKFLKEIIMSLLSHHLIVEAGEFLASYPVELQGTPDYLGLRYAVDERNFSRGESIAKGRELLSKGVQEYPVYLALIQRSIEVGYADHAEKLLSDAISQWPDKERELKEVASKTQRVSNS
jgi:tetratricopeptide (TPR) repeat protein